ncbi:uncharacterized protein J7T55_000284 [Diaporthe amygdali]|uniref:uncharacterized protein n=1 Tax=Phomopsis amygdali TaxID=1214568 RepID=UPI0022FEAB88|nr:uncharacterized protein J7T55_000284 [Diaporthe amygdali]KAJ0109359.1 uncharacterized protein J7T55_000284 [Diaporthe amygdali]
MNLSASTTTEARRVYCVYPVSGNYTSFQRSLFYLTTAFALFGHAHEWLTAGALAFAVSYSSTAAVHGIALALQREPQYDGDIDAVGCIVPWATYASFACALFCPRLLGRNLAPLVHSWTCLLVACNLALAFNSTRLYSKTAASLVLSRRGGDGAWSDPCAGMELRTLFRGYPGDSMSSVVWGSVNVTDVSLAQPAGADGGIVRVPDVVRLADLVWLIVLQSLRNCLMVAPSIRILAADRRASRNDVFVRLLAKRVLYPPSAWKGPKMFPAIVIVRFLQLYWFLLECLPFLSVVDVPIRIAAHTLSWYFRMREVRLQDLSFLEPQLSPRRYQAAKLIAMAVYTLTTLGYVTWLPVVASFARSGAGRLPDIPESETFRAVGQWSPWLALGLAVVTALASRLLRRWDTEGESGQDHMKSMDSWMQHHRFRLVYTEIRNWLAAEWGEATEWWRHPEKEAIASLRAAEQDDDSDDRFTSRMIQALEAFSTDRDGFILPLSVPRQPNEQLRGQDGQPLYSINVEPITLRNIARKVKEKKR